MFQNKEDFFFADVEQKREVAYLNFSLEKIKKFISLSKLFSKKNSLIFDESNILNFKKAENLEPIKKIIFKYEPIKGKELIVNVKSNTIYIFCSQEGMKNFQLSLLSLQESLERGIIDDVSYMVSDWGGDSLINKQIIQGANVILHLRLYGN